MMMLNALANSWIPCCTFCAIAWPTGSKVRAEWGKPARGRITIRAAQEADFVYLTFEDDDGGIDREAVRPRDSLPTAASLTTRPW